MCNKKLYYLKETKNIFKIFYAFNSETEELSCKVTKETDSSGEGSGNGERLIDLNNIETHVNNLKDLVTQELGGCKKLKKNLGVINRLSNTLKKAASQVPVTL